MTISKYDLLIEKDHEANKHFLHFRAVCTSLILKIVENLISYLNCPKDRVDWVPFSKEAVIELKNYPDFIDVFDGNRIAVFLSYRSRFALHFRLGEPRFSPNIVEFRFNIQEYLEGYKISDGQKEFKVDKDLHIEPELMDYIYNSLDEFVEDHFLKKQSSLGYIALISDLNKPKIS